MTATDEDQGLNWENVIVNPDETLSFQALDLPAWLSLDASGFLVGTPSDVDIGQHEVSVQVTDAAGAIDYQTFKIAVANTNDAPILNPIQNIILHEDQHLSEFDHIVNPFELKFDASDEDSSNLTFEYFALDGLTLTEANQQYGGFGFLSHNSNGQMNFTPTNHYVGEHGILVKVSDDDGASDSQISTLQF